MGCTWSRTSGGKKVLRSQCEGGPFRRRRRACSAGRGGFEESVWIQSAKMSGNGYEQQGQVGNHPSQRREDGAFQAQPPVAEAYEGAEVWMADNGGHEVGQVRRQREGTALSDARSPAANRQRPDAYQHGQQAAPAPMNPWSAAQWGQAAMATAMPGNGQYGQMLQALGQPAGQYSAPPSTYGDATSTYSAVCAAISVYEHQIVRQDFRLVWSMLA